MQRLNGWMTTLVAGFMLAGVAAPVTAKPARPAVRQEPDPAVVSSVRWIDGKLRFEADRPLNARLFALEAPYRVVIDLYGAELSDPTLLQAVPIASGPYRALRGAMHAEEGFIRFVLDCDRPTSIQLTQTAGGQLLDLKPHPRHKGEPLLAMASERFGPDPAPVETYGPELPPVKPVREAYGPPEPEAPRLVYGPPLPERVREPYGPPAPEATPEPEPPTADEPTPVWNGEPQRLSGLHLQRRKGVTTLRLESERRLAVRVQQEWAPPRLVLRIPKGSYNGALPNAFEGVEALSAQQDGSDWVLKLDLSRAVYTYDARRKAGGRTLEVSWKKAAIAESRPTVVLDAGHGGDDPGAIGPGGTYEAKVNLGLAQAVKAALDAKGDVNVVMSRTADVSVDLASRARLVQALRPSLFVSLHGNSCETPEIGGLETYYRHDTSLPLARHLHADLVKALGRPDRGVRQGRLYVLRNSEIPSVLLESAYLSNPQEEKLMASESFQKDLGEALARSIVDYLKTPVAELPISD